MKQAAAYTKDDFETMTKDERLLMIRSLYRGPVDRYPFYKFVAGEIYVIVGPVFHDELGAMCIAVDITENKQVITLIKGGSGQLINYHWTRVIPMHMLGNDIKISYRDNDTVHKDVLID